MEILETTDTALLRNFLTAKKHDFMVCTANKAGKANVTVYGTPRLNNNNQIQFEVVSNSVTYHNIQENKNIVFMVVVPGNSIPEYKGIRIYANVATIYTQGTVYETVKEQLLMAGQAQKAATLLATVVCNITQIRPVVDHGQPWETAL